jgi:integrase
MKGSIQKRHRADGTIAYTAIYRTPEGRQKWRAFDRQKDAEKFLTATVKTVHDGAYEEVRPAPMATVLDQWLERSLAVRVKQGLLKPSTASSYRSMVAAHLRPSFGAVPSDKLGRQHVGEWVGKLADQIVEGDLAPKSYNNVLNLFHAILEWARLEQYLVHDPLRGQKRLPKPKVEREFLEPDEIEQLLKVATTHPPDDTILRVAVYTGLRRGELFALQWGDVAWGTGEGGQISVRRSIYHGQVTSPKTAQSVRTVDVPQPVLADLQLYRLMYPAKPGDLIFRTDTGSPLDPDNWTKRRFLPMLEEAGLRRMGLHALRHTYASLLINQGEGIKYASKQLGHASIQITADLYGHLFKETSLAAMRRLGDGMAARANAALTEPAIEGHLDANSRNETES